MNVMISLSGTERERCFISSGASSETLFNFKDVRFFEGLSCLTCGIKLICELGCVGKVGVLELGESGGGIVWNPKLGVEDSDSKAG